jgi:uncharacterized membrane protein
MWNWTICGIDLYHLISWFIIYSFFGWVWETAYVSIKEGKYVNRGFINGPLCTIYGCGAVAVYLILQPLENNLLFLFLGGIVVTTMLEYITAVLMESIFHTSWWDYSDRKLNFQGRICLEASLGWGAFSVILFRVLHPLVVDIVELYPVYVGEIGICVIAVAYVCDFCTSAAAAFHLHERIPAWEQALEERQGELLVSLNGKLNAWADSRGISLPELRERLDVRERLDKRERLDVRERLEDVELLRTVEEKRQILLEEVSAELKSYKHALAGKLGHNTRRFVKAYPHLNRGYKLRHKLKNNKKD